MYDITSVTKSDEGSYSCMAENEAGQFEDRFHVRKIGFLCLAMFSLLVKVGERPNGFIMTLQLVVDDYAEPDYNIIDPPRPTQRPRDEVYYFPVGSRAELRCMQGRISFLHIDNILARFYKMTILTIYCSF
jgi:hypothetical protein